MRMAAILFLITILCSCNEFTASFYEPKTAEEVLKNRCVSCHGYLEKGDEYLTQLGYIKPGSPNESVIYKYIKKSKAKGPQNMPPRGELSDKELSLIENWIINVKPKPVLAGEKKVHSLEPLNDLEIFDRCSVQLTNFNYTKAPKHLITSIKHGDISGVQGCLKIIENSFLKKDGSLIDENTSSKNTLLTFQKLHNNWFNEWNFFVAMSSWGTFEVLDPGTMGYFFSKSLLDSEMSFKDIFKGKQSYEAIRKSPVKTDYLVYKFKDEPRYKVNEYRFVYGLSEGSNYKEWFPNRVPSGVLVGIKEIPKNRDVLKNIVNSKDNQKEINPAKEIKVNKDIHEGLGGGILGSEVFVNLNLGQDLGKKMNGGRILPRRWSKAIINELLCRDLPVIPIKKAVSFVQKSSQISFRQKESCMACHATMDPMANLVRNVEQSYSADAGGDGMIHSTHLRFHKEDKKYPRELAPVDDDPFFHLRPAYGRFIYQDVRGNYIDKEIKSLDELGSTLLETDDLYLCTVKKYFNFFTGIDVHMNLFIQGAHSPEELYIKNLLEESSKSLKQSGDLSQAIGILLNSKVYRSKSFKVSE